MVQHQLPLPSLSKLMVQPQAQSMGLLQVVRAVPKVVTRGWEADFAHLLGQA